MKMLKIGILAGVICLAFCDCGPPLKVRLRSLTGSRTGCAPGEVKIYNLKRSFGLITWMAECRGKLYACSKMRYCADPQLQVL